MVFQVDSTVAEGTTLWAADSGMSLTGADMPLRYSESFFFRDSLFHPGLADGRLGVAGEPVPYAIANDYFFSSLLLGCLMLTLWVYSRSRGFIARQLKALWFGSRPGHTVMTETLAEWRAQFILGVQTCLLFSMVYFSYCRVYVAETFVIGYGQLIMLFVAVFVAYFLAKALLFLLVGWVFFDMKKIEQWMKSFLFLTVVEGVLLLPLIFLQTYFHLSMQSSVSYTLFVVFLVKFLSFYKSRAIFFRGKGAYLQIILYFCALEMMPLLTLWSVLGMIADELKINF